MNPMLRKRARLLSRHSGKFLALCSLLGVGCAEVPGDAPDSNSAPAASASASTGRPTLPAPDAKKTMATAIINIPPYIMAFTPSSNPVAIGGETTLTATTNKDIGPTPYYIEIFDVTTGEWLTWCGYGTSCSTTVSQSAGATHAFVAYVAANVTETNPPGGIQSASANTFVTWSDSGYTVSVPPSISCFTTGTITATANVDVWTTPYYIEIFNGNGTKLRSCPGGSSCSVVAACTGQYYAFISESSASFPPAGTQASSNPGVMYPQPK
jgi:hypothetical protein